MLQDINKQNPWTVSQISNSKPNIPKTASILSGYVGTSLNGGHNKTITYKKVMAGEKHYEYRMKMKIQMLTPITPTYQPLKMTVRSYFVPNSRVWDNAEKYTAQKGGSAEIKIDEIPNLGGKVVPSEIYDDGNLKKVNISNTTFWRDTFISSYLPRVGNFEATLGTEYKETVLPKVSVLPLRGRVAIYNDFERNKEYDEIKQEYKGDTVSESEWASYLVTEGLKFRNELDFYTMRSKKENSYYTDFRTEIQGFESSLPEPSADKSLITWASWESKIAEARSQAENAQLNDWDIIAKIRGSKKLSEGKVQLIGQQTFNLNYAAITQNTYNNNENVQEQFRVLGKQGAYSYTEIDIPCYAGMEFVEEGYVHIIATVTADTIYEKAFDRMELNVTPLDEYRPDLEGDKFDVLYEIETDSTEPNNSNIIGFKRKYSEYFKLGNHITADMTSDNYYDIKDDGTLSTDEIETQKTFQFFETQRNSFLLPSGRYLYKKPWKDYSDLMINKNQAILNEVVTFSDLLADAYEIYIKGQNQIFMLNQCYCLCELPIHDSIKKNYTTWGEH